MLLTGQSNSNPASSREPYDGGNISTSANEASRGSVADRVANGPVVAHIDVLGKVPPDTARIRVSEVATGVTVWEAKPATARRANREDP